MTSPTSLPRLSVYFDGSCPLCRREIAMYRGLPAAQHIDWVDVSAGAALGEGLSCETAMRRFHVRTGDGRLYSGAAAFSVLWRQLPGWRLLGWLTAVPPLSWFAELAYRLFLPLRPALQRGVRHLTREAQVRE